MSLAKAAEALISYSTAFALAPSSSTHSCYQRIVHGEWDRTAYLLILPLNFLANCISIPLVMLAATVQLLAIPFFIIIGAAAFEPEDADAALKLLCGSACINLSITPLICLARTVVPNTCEHATQKNLVSPVA